MEQTFSCVKCGMVNQASNRFCGGCGLQFFTYCPYCGFNYSPQYKYCVHCGKKLIEDNQTINSNNKIELGTLLTRIENVNSQIDWNNAKLRDSIAHVEEHLEKVINILDIQTKSLLKLLKKFPNSTTSK